MRMMLLLLPALLLASCVEDNGPADRIVLSGPIKLSHAGKPDMAMFRKVYVDSSGSKALFFLGDENGLTVEFVDSNGLVDMTRILSRETAASLKPDDPALAASNAANTMLSETMLPDRSFKVLPAQGGFLIQATYGKLSFISYAALSGGNLKLGGRVDMDLLAQLLNGGGMSNAFRVLPQIGDPGATEHPSRLLLFSSVPDTLGDAIADNAGALFRHVTSAGGDWQPTDLAAPASLSDTSAIQAISVRVGGYDPNMGNMTDSMDANVSAYDFENTTTTTNAAGPAR